MKRILLIFLAGFWLNAAFAQDWAELSRLQQQLRDSKPDTAQVDAFLRLAEFETFKPGEYKTDLDSAAAYIDQAEQLNSKLHSPDAAAFIVIERSYLAKDHEDRKTGKALMDKAISLLSKGNNKYLLATAYQGLADYYDYYSPKELPQKISYLQHAADLYKAGGFIEKEAYCDKCLAEILEDNDQAFKKALEALALYRSINYKKLQGVYDLCCQFYSLKNDLKNSLIYGLLALKTAKEQNDHSGNLVEIEANLAGIYGRIKDYDNMFRYLSMSFNTAKVNGDANTQVFLVTDIAKWYRYLNQLSNAQKTLHMVSDEDVSKAVIDYQYAYYLSSLSVYTGMRKFDLAEQASQKLIPLFDNDIILPDEKLKGYNMLASYFLDRRQMPKVDYYLARSEDALRVLKFPDNPNNMYQALLFRRDTLLHNYKASLLRLMKIYKHADSLNNNTYLTSIRKLQMQYDTKEKEHQITFLKQRSSLQTQNLKQATMVKNYTFGGVLLLAVIAGLLYRQNRLKQRNNKLVTTKNELLERLVEEKEWLLKEVHHRVKNNLHTVICLLESQAAYLENDALKAIESSQHRIYAMSLIHQKLYQSDDIKTIDMDVYLKEFTNYLNDSFGNPEQIGLQSNIQPVKLNVAQAIPIGLIVNEAVTNAFKYAFPNGASGAVRVSLQESGELFELIVQDNGIGLPGGIVGKDLDSLGMELIKGLSRDLRGKLEISGNNGTMIKILFEARAFD